MTIFESWHSSRAFGRQLELPLLASLARVLAVVMSVYLMIRFLDLSQARRLGLLNRTAPRPGCSLWRSRSWWCPWCCCTSGGCGAARPRSTGAR